MARPRPKTPTEHPSEGAHAIAAIVQGSPKNLDNEEVRMSLSTHVLDAVHGLPAHGLAVKLERRDDSAWTLLAQRITDVDGRIPDLSTGLAEGVYRIVFDTEHYLDVETFYPEVAITFRVTSAGEHYHVPLLLSPYAYSTYRGS
jgi:5-hydroxyisourate hydrolase